MSSGFEQIKDAGQLQDYLSKHVAAGGQVGKITKARDASPSANDYTTLKEFKASKRQGGASPSNFAAGQQAINNNNTAS